MMALGDAVRVTVVTDRTPNEINCASGYTAEELCTYLCKKYKIPPLTRTLFALRIKGSNYFLQDNYEVLRGSKDYELRIRYKIPRLEHLSSSDERTYDYYYQQARNDVNENKIPEVKYPEHKKELLGLGIADMCRALLDNVPLNEVKKNYKKYVPKIILKQHGPFPKKYAYKYLPEFLKKRENFNVLGIKNEYLRQLYELAPNYLSEEYEGLCWKVGSESRPVRVQVAPFHADQPGIRLYNTQDREWIPICKMEELIYLTRNDNCCLEVSRRGTPIFLNFKCEKQLSSFISVCDGYYRLMVKWTFNLSYKDETPSLRELHRMKCHGPVGGAFSYRKLEERRGKKHGCYILRQCQEEYNAFYIDVCTKNCTTESYKLEFIGHAYIFNKEEYGSVERLVASHQNPEGRIYLSECIPPSEYDKSQLLLCGQQKKFGVRIDQGELQEILKDNKSPRCLSTKDILLYTGSEKIGASGTMATHKALWKLDETKKLEVAFKSLQRDKAADNLKDFIDLASKWACISSNCIVRLYGITLCSPTAMVLEFLPYGPFDFYLRRNKRHIKPLHLKKIAASLARALWDLSEAGIVHGYIRCRRLLVASSDEERITVKLSGPSLHTYTNEDVHWIPVEYLSDMSLVRRQVAGDIWAFATTLWEMFSFGHSPNDLNPVLTAKSYENGTRLHRPDACPSEVWELVRSCWHADPHLRVRPQELMRDMNYMLHSEYVPLHKYEKIQLTFKEGDAEHDTVSSDRLTNEMSETGSNKSLISVNSSNPSLDDTLSDHFSAGNKSSESLDSLSMACPLSGKLSRSHSRAFSGFSLARPHSPDAVDAAPLLMETILSQGATYLVTMINKIGSGNYGTVYKGWMEQDNREKQTGREVAVKTLNRQERNGSVYADFKNEFEIMKSLVHENIVEILGYSWDHDSQVLIVMEYMEQGSLSQYLHSCGDKLKIWHLLKYALDIATGMDHISAKNIVHRDLAARNILVVNKHHVKISDFGLARIIPKEESSYTVKSERYLPFNWYAPESTQEKFLFSTKSDVWSYGVTCWEIFNLCKKEVPKFDIQNPTKRASVFTKPEGCPQEVYRRLLESCWQLDPSRRPSFINLVHLCKSVIIEYK